MLRMDVTAPDFTTKPLPFLGIRTAYRRFAQLAMVLCDVTMVGLAFALAYWLRFYGGITVADDVPLDPAKYLGLMAVFLPVWLAIFWAMHLYDYHYLLGGTSEYTQALNASTIGMMAVVLVSFMVPDLQISRAWLIMSWVFSCLFVCGGRFTLRRIAYQLRRAGYFVAPALIVGTNQEALALASQLRDRRASGLAVLGFVTDEETSLPVGQRRSYGGFPVVGDLASLPEIVRQYGVREVIIAGTALDDTQRVEVLERLINLPDLDLRLSSGLYEILTTSVHVTTRASVPLMTLSRLRLGRLETALKTALDVGLIVLALPLLLPLFGAIALLIKLDSPGAVFHRRRVLGVNGTQFDALKFRSMVENGDEVLAQYPELRAELKRNHKLKYDPRVTRVGQWLRKTSLDELPQLLNVLRGQMSLVGPRMISPEEADLYGTMHLNLLTVKPGLTGMWQVSGRSNLSYEERVRLDMHYIRNYSIWLDLQILVVQTLPAVLAKRGAY